jgi:hypothetical protein
MDFIEETFSSLDEFYPNSKRKKKSLVAKENKKVKDLVWDAKPYKKLLHGREVEMFTIGALSKALDRPVVTLYQWMDAGYLPTSPYRLPDTKGKNGATLAGRRLYTREMIEAAVNLFSRFGLLEKSRIDWAVNRKLSQELSEVWVKIRAKETLNETTESHER